jgi:arylsulfatase A-like enzyme
MYAKYVQQFMIRLLIYVCFFSVPVVTQSQQRPNIIFIFSDDHDADAISAYNNNLISTPGIDRLAREGMMFNKHFVANAICAPARATILTGKFSHMNGHKDNRTAFDTSQYLFPRQLQQAGYQTALIGKWHLQTLPAGFNYWEVLPGQGQYYKPRFINMKNDTITYPNAYATTLTTDKAMHWLDNRDRSKPFMLMVNHKAPHRNWWPEYKHAVHFSKVKIPEPPTLYADTAGKGKAYRAQEMRILEDMSLCIDLKIDPVFLENIPLLKPSEKEVKDYHSMIAAIPEELRNKLKTIYSERGETLQRLKPTGKELLKWKYQWYMQDYLACIASVDESVGSLLTYLDSNGLAENTLVIYSSDQGFYLGENGWFDKRFMYDVSMQSPLLMRWRGKIQPGSVNNALTQNIDLAATILDVAGEKIPSEIQGISLKPFFSGKAPASKRTSLYYHYYEFPVDHHVYPHLGIRTNQHKLIYFYTIGEWELYDLKTDPGENNNIYSQTKYKSLVSKLKKELVEKRAFYKDTEPAGELN